MKVERKKHVESEFKTTKQKTGFDDPTIDALPQPTKQVVRAGQMDARQKEEIIRRNIRLEGDAIEIQIALFTEAYRDGHEYGSTG